MKFSFYSAAVVVARWRKSAFPHSVVWLGSSANNASEARERKNESSWFTSYTQSPAHIRNLFNGLWKCSTRGSVASSIERVRLHRNLLSIYIPKISRREKKIVVIVARILPLRFHGLILGFQWKQGEWNTKWESQAQVTVSFRAPHSACARGRADPSVIYARKSLG